jgi:2-amino-4-hydroxy-6-hydroxymethyldihydropteridine diphosphokinase
VKKIAYLSLGSNLGDRCANLENALQRLQKIGAITARSSFYETEPQDMREQPWFLNCAVALETELMPKQLLHATLGIEREMGRRRAGRGKGPRIIDIDILLFGSSVVETKDLMIPHPRMHQRRFVLQPMAEIAPDVRHPILKKTMRELLAELPAGPSVRRMD